MTGPKLTGCRCQCPTCGEFFGNVRGFDRHRIGTVGEPDRRCLSAAEMICNGWHRNARGFLLTPDPRHAGAGVAGARAAPAATGVAAPAEPAPDARVAA